MADEPATQRQKAKLRFFGIEFPKTLTKRAASELLDRIDDPARELKYRAYRDKLDAKQEAADDMNLRIDTWQSSLEMRDLDYRKVSRAKIKDVLTFLDETATGWDAGSFSPLFYDTLEARHPEVLKTATPRRRTQQSSAGCLVTFAAFATLSISLLWFIRRDTSNHAMQPTAGRREGKFLMTQALPLQPTRVLTSGG